MGMGQSSPPFWPFRFYSHPFYLDFCKTTVCNTNITNFEVPCCHCPIDALPLLTLHLMIPTVTISNIFAAT